MWKFTHRECNGTGKIPNPFFEECQDDDPLVGCDECHRIDPERYERCNRGEIIPCEGCDGTGKLELWEDEWDLERL